MQKDNNRKVPTLFNERKDCCGCRACLNTCPKNAISMNKDEYGFYYPEINEDLCIGCNKCIGACSFQRKEEENDPLYSYAAASKSDKILKSSASGGVFTTLANYIIEKMDGIVYGAAFDKEWSVQHVGVNALEQLHRLQGSKYVQSDTNTTYAETKMQLEAGKMVLYSGTPCQIAGLYGFLGKEYDNLITVDLVCHGVPSEQMFRDYIKVLENKHNGKVVDFKFRDKTKGWGINGVCIIKNDTSEKKVDLWQSASSYLYYFSKAYIYRDSCYSCKYASKNRPADITIGDFWGVEKVQNELLSKRGWNEQKGISLIVVNTEKGQKVIKDISQEMQIEDSSFEKVSKYNHQLNAPSKMQEPNPILDIYKVEGWKSVEARFNHVMGFRKHTSLIKALIPSRIKNVLKRVKG